MRPRSVPRRFPGAGSTARRPFPHHFQHRVRIGGRLLTAGCSAAGTGASASAEGLTTLTVAAVPGIDDAPLYIAAA